MNCRVVINRGPGADEHFDGFVIAETTTHCLVKSSGNPVGEWFARRSKCVSVMLFQTPK